MDTEKVKTAVLQALGSGAGGNRRPETLNYLRELVDAMARDGTRRDGPLREIPARLGDKWSMLILLLLRGGTFRHSELQKLIAIMSAEGNISQRMLTLRLRALERDGFIFRHPVATQPAGVEYGMSALGNSLLTQIDLLLDWIRAHRDDINRGREEFKAVEAKPQP